MKNIGFCSCPIVKARHLRAEATGLCKRTAVLTRLDRASDISWKKNAKFRGIFRGKFAEKSADFAGFSREKSQNSRKNRPILRDFRGRKVKIRRKIGRFRGILAEKSQISKDFRGKFLEKSADFTGNFWGKLLQETISKKQPISLDFFWQISLKSINFASI